ncbi:MAG TPA: hypothetical protein PK869_08615, partial [Candidatus Hydrogenedentes bacterium]|nr:hypothetical protein [Candidatus Hydrogenedentota bacterium]
MRTRKALVATDWQLAIKPGDVIVDFAGTDYPGESLGRVWCNEVVSWDQFNPDDWAHYLGAEELTNETHVLLRPIGAKPDDLSVGTRATIEAVLTPAEVEALTAAEWPEEFQDFLTA